MSHNVTIEGIKVTDKVALMMAVNELAKEGRTISFRDGPGASFRAWGGRENPCDFAVRIDGGQYDIGFRKGRDGAYEPILESYLRDGVTQSPVSCSFTPGKDNPENRSRQAIGVLMQRYAVCLTEREAAQKGYTAQRMKGDNDSIKVAVTVG